MANPQLEDGYTKIANETLEALAKINLSSYQSRLLFVIFRKTYGFGKKDDWLSVSQLVELTGLRKQHTSRAKKQLIDRKIVTSRGNKVQFCKDYSQWCELPKSVTNKKVTNTGVEVTNRGSGVTNRGSKVTNTGEHKRNYTKETITKETIQKKGTPAQTTQSFIKSVKEKNTEYQEFITLLSGKYKIQPNKVSAELDKFTNYWTELNGSGTKQRWQMEKTFEVRKRLTTWLGRVNTYSGKKQRTGTIIN